MTGRTRRSAGLGAALVVVVVGVTVAVTILALLLRTDMSRLVQPQELDLAGQQRRLSERVALDVALLSLEPGDEQVRSELDATAAQLRRIRTGLLDGDDGLDLDGRLPEEVRELYSPEGLDLQRRLQDFEDAATAVASAPEAGAAPPPVLAREVRDERLVQDLDDVVARLAARSAQEGSERRFVLALGIIVLVVATASAAWALVAVRRSERRRRLENERLEGELADSEALYRGTVDALVDGVVIQDERGRVLRMNAAAHDILVSNLDDVAPGTGDDFAGSLPQMLDADGTALPDERRPARRAQRSGVPVVGQVVGLTRGVDVRWFRCGANPIADPRHPSSRVVLTFADVTDEKKMTASLAEQERRFRLALEHAPIGMALVAADGSFMKVNQALCELTGRPHDRLLATTFQEITHPDDLDADVAHVERLLAGEADTYRMEKRYLTPDGQVVHIQLAVAIVRPEGAAPYFIAQVLDIGDRKLAERAQMAALEHERAHVAKLTDLDRAKTRFVSTVSHELRTPLTSALGYLELLSEGAGGELGERQRDLVVVAERNCQRLLGLIEDLLSVAEIETAQRRAVRVEVEVAAVVDHVIATVEPLARRQGLEIVVEQGWHGGPILADPAHVERALLNVAGNAVKFTPSGGSVAIRSRPSDQDPDTLQLVVSDTGIGIPHDEQDQIFSRFFRSSNASATAIPGTGLGLAIAADLVHALGGSIHLESLEGVGTTVIIELSARGAQSHHDNAAHLSAAEPT